MVMLVLLTTAKLAVLAYQQAVWLPEQPAVPAATAQAPEEREQASNDDFTSPAAATNAEDEGEGSHCDCVDNTHLLGLLGAINSTIAHTPARRRSALHFHLIVQIDERRRLRTL